MTDETLVQDLISTGKYLISEHGREELASDDIDTVEVVSGVSDAEVIES
jgi:hypothetical protein